MGTDISFALTVFSVFAPAGAIAFLLLSLMVLLGEESENGRRLEHWLILPLSVCMTGLVASATHLGTPSNALYVFMGWGRSPLSNEVAAAVCFMFAAGLLWLCSFNERVPARVFRILLVPICLMSLWLVGMISVVYSIHTIPTWNGPLVPFILWSMAFTTGPVLAIATVTFAERTSTYATRAARRAQSDSATSDKEIISSEPSRQRLSFLRAFAVTSLVAIFAGVGMMMAQDAELGSISNSLGVATDLAPQYTVIIAAYAILGITGIAVQALPLSKGKIPRRRMAFFSVALIFAGSFAVRTVFYSLRMTTGF